MTTTRSAAVAGLFYPDDRRELHNEVERMLREARAVNGAAPQAMIQPHAGYPYSGPVAATGYLRLRRARPDVARVVLVGPNHTVPLAAMAVSAADEWLTPLGMVPVDAELREHVAAAPLVEVADRPHAREHALEVHLPFLQRVLSPGWTLLPVVVGDCPAESVATLIDRCWGEDTLVVVSSDLSHYHGYTEAVRIDEITVEEIVLRRVEAIDPRRACGCYPIRGLLASRHVSELAVEVLDVRNSGDTAGDHHQVVGYASIVFC
jgi:AmmeMemoRadiSam system protein B